MNTGKRSDKKVETHRELVDRHFSNVDIYIYISRGNCEVVFFFKLANE